MSLSSWEFRQRTMTSKTTLERLTMWLTCSRRLRMRMMASRVYLIRFGGQEDLIVAFFPCIYFCDAKVMFFRGVYISQRNKALHEIMDWNIGESQTRQYYFQSLMKLVSVVSKRNLRMIIENPWNTSRGTYLQTNFISPTLVDSNRTIRGDYYVKPTAYWFINCTNTYGFTEQKNDKPRIVYKEGSKTQVRGVCDQERSMISPDYARNFICDFILGKEQIGTQLNLF